MGGGAQQGHTGAVRQRPLRRRPRHARRHVRPAGPHPGRLAPRRLSLQFLERCSEPSRPVAADDAGELPNRAAGLGDAPRRRRPGRQGRRGLGHGRKLRAAPQQRSRAHLLLARRQRRRGAARVRPRNHDLRGGRLRAAGGQGRCVLARPGHASAVQRVGQRHGHQLRLCAHRASVAARHPCRDRPRAVRDDAGPHAGGRRARPDPGDGDGLVQGAADIHRRGHLDGRPHGPEGEDRSAQRRRRGRPSGVDAGEPSHRVERRCHHLCVGHAARDAAGALPSRRAHLHRPLRAGRATYVELVFLVQWAARAVDPR